jgi:hypothetical protein
MGRKRLFTDREKWCNRCRGWLSLDAFGTNRRNASGKQDYCKTCHGSGTTTWWEKVASIDKLLLTKFQMQPGEYLDQWRHQERRCVACKAALILYQRDTRVHALGQRRLLLCADCDKGLTAFHDDIGVLQRVIALLKS